MSGSRPLKLGFIPLTDAAPLIAAQARGLFEAEGVAVELSREASWATVRDKVAVGALDGAHMLAPMTLASTLGLGSAPVAMIAPIALNLNGAAVTVSARLTAAMEGEPDAAGLARLIARRREQGASRLTFAVVHAHSVHNYLLRSWMAQAGIDPDEDVRLTFAPPPRTAELLADGVIEGFCAGEPWNAVAVAAGVGRVAARAAQVMARAPDKVFGVTEAWSERHPERLQALLRALLRGAAWADDPENRAELADLLARPEHVGVDAGLIASGLAEIVFQRDGANAPLPAQGEWLLGEMKRWRQVGPDIDAPALAARVQRPDLYRAATEAVEFGR